MTAILWYDGWTRTPVNTALNIVSWLKWKLLPTMPFPLPVCVYFRSQTHLESSPASSDFTCFGNLDPSIKAHPPISLCIYEGVMKTKRDDRCLFFKSLQFVKHVLQVPSVGSYFPLKINGNCWSTNISGDSLSIHNLMYWVESFLPHTSQRICGVGAAGCYFNIWYSCIGITMQIECWVLSVAVNYICP